MHQSAHAPDIRKEVQEKYLRDDLGFGLLHGAVVSAEDLVEAARGALGRGEAYGWVVPDTNVVLHQMDVLEHRGVECGVLDRLVICQTVAEEVRRNDRDIFRRLCASSGVPREKGTQRGSSNHDALWKTSVRTVTSTRERHARPALPFFKRKRGAPAASTHASRGKPGEAVPGRRRGKARRDSPSP